MNCDPCLLPVAQKGDPCREVKDMKIIKAFVIAALFLVIPGPLRAEGLGGLHISYLDGDVQVAPADGSDWLPASLNMPLQQGDRLWVPDEARLELQFASGAVIRLDRESALDILALDEASAQVYLAQGRAYLNSWNLSEGSLDLSTPLASARALNRSIFTADVAEDGTTHIAVLKGVVDVGSRSGATAVSAGTTIAVRDEGYADIGSPGYPDAWEEWNRERDSRFAGEGEGESYRYLPAELRTYAADLDANGRWMYAEGYDRVWVPSGTYAADWAPYRLGRWVWVGGDYVWISYEPWGWAPYHYGRWVHAAGIGWCWVPPAAGAAYWGPGFVSWVTTPDYVAWLPLAPGEIYHGYGYYGPASVNITNVTVYTAPKPVVYKNVHVHNSFTVISREAFLSGKVRTIHIKENPFLREHAGHGRPQWKPRKETRAPVFKEIPQRRLPPQRLREITAKEIRPERPVTPGRTRPVIKRGEPGPRVIVPTERERKTQIAPQEIPQRPDVQKPFGKPGPRVIVPADKERESRIAPRAIPQRPDVQRPFTVKPDEKPQSIREAVQKRQDSRDRTKSVTQPPTRVPGATPYHGRTAPEEVKQHSQPPSKVAGRPEPAVKQQSVRSARPGRPGETQKARPEKPEFEGRDKGERERPEGREAFGKERRN
jgi:hypothetical protein